MNTRIICRFASQEAIDDFNKRNGTDLTQLTKEYDVNTKTKVEKKPTKKKAKKDDSARDAKWKDQWWQMPMYESHDAAPPFAQVDFKFNEGDLELANKLFDQNISDKTISVWYPKLIPGWYSQLRVVGGSSEHRYPIYVISKGRAQKCYTSRFLTQMEVKHFVVCEPSEYQEYKQYVENQYATLLQLDMSYKDVYDTCDNMGPEFPKGSGPARNFVWDDSVKRGAKWHWIMDDNATEGFHWFWHNVKVKCRTGALLAACEDFVDRYENIGQFGLNYKMFVTMDSYHAPYTMNTRIYSCILNRNDITDKNGKPYRWRARFNEDTDLSLRILKDGWCTVLANWALFGKSTTMKVKGGNTTSIYVNGTKEKSEMIANLHPDVAKVVWKFHRWHHEVDYSVFKQELKLKPGVVPIPGENNYGMRVINTQEEDTFDTKAMLAQKYANAPDYVYGVDCPNTAETVKVEPTTVVQAPKTETKELHVVSIWKDPPTPPPPKVEEAPKNMVSVATEKPVQEVVKPTLPPFEIVIGKLDEIDPRALGKLMIELMDKVDLTIVHGDKDTQDVVVKLCAGLGVAWTPVQGPDNAPIFDKYVGKKVLTRCQAGEKPVFGATL